MNRDESLVKALARSELGQPLAVKDASVSVLERVDVIKTLASCFAPIPGDDVVCVHGEEGVGKSWIAIQSWLAQPERPLLVFATPDEVSEITTQDDVEALLIARLIAQTGDSPGNDNAIRWRRRLHAWKGTQKLSRPRIVVVIDGINQRPDRPWGKIISSVATYVKLRGGRVVVTARTHYFHTRVRKALSYSAKAIEIPKWSPAERDEILNKRGIPPNKLNQKIGEFLRNPRLLAIALEVFGTSIASFEELSVDRLLFEHIAAGARQDYGDDPADFVARLQEHAKELLRRAAESEKGDLYVFEADVPAVADGRFYHPVAGEPRKYELRDEGLTLALGFSIIARMRAAKRGERDLDDSLKEILEPIAALDRTADAVIAALAVIAADDDAYSAEITTALIKGAAELQNLPPHTGAVLSSLARARPVDFANAARGLSLEGGHQPNMSWIDAALILAAQRADVWFLLVPEIRKWLRSVSRSPDYAMLSHHRHDAPEKVAEERAKRQAEIDGKRSSLSEAEQSRLSRLIETNGQLDVLSHLALRLLAGKELQTFADVLVDWSFAHALNGSYQVRTKDFLALISLNRRDWIETRAALLKECETLRPEAASKTGKWALLRVLRATGDPVDWQEADNLFRELTKDRPPFPRLTEQQRLPDSTNPSATAPLTLDAIAQRYGTIDVGELKQSIGQTAQDAVFAGDRPILARFALQQAVEKHREFASDVSTRTGTPLRQGLFELREHRALVTAEQARALTARWRDAQAADDLQGLSSTEAFLLQYELIVGFPFLDAAEQIEILLATAAGEPLLVELFDQLKVPDGATLDRFLCEAQSSGSEHKQYVLFEIAAVTGAKLTEAMCAFAVASISSAAEGVRSSALRLAALSAHPQLLKAVAESQWESSASEHKDSFESWYGSLALLKAAAAGFIDDAAVLDRMSSRLYGLAAAQFNGPALKDVARRIDASTRCAARLPNILIGPDIVADAKNSSDLPVRFSVSERETAPRNPLEALDRLSESNEAFQARQDRGHRAFVAFKGELTAKNAHGILDRLERGQLARLVSAEPALADAWYQLFMELHDSNVPPVHNLMVLLASVIADSEPTKSAALLERAARSSPLVKFTFGKGGIDLDSLSAWQGARSPVLDALRRDRLDSAATDHAIVVEVLSAQRAGHLSFIEEYVEAEVARPEPSHVARGLMVAGFCDKSSCIDGVLERYQDTSGLPGKAREAAITAYQSNMWARHWFTRLCETDDPLVFWQASVLFAECADGRFDLWGKNVSRTGRAVAMYGTDLSTPLDQRYQKVATDRRKQLFGTEAPAALFVKLGV